MKTINYDKSLNNGDCVIRFRENRHTVYIVNGDVYLTRSMVKLLIGTGDGYINYNIDDKVFANKKDIKIVVHGSTTKIITVYKYDKLLRKTNTNRRLHKTIQNVENEYNNLSKTKQIESVNEDYDIRNLNDLELLLNNKGLNFSDEIDTRDHLKKHVEMLKLLSFIKSSSDIFNVIFNVVKRDDNINETHISFDFDYTIDDNIFKIKTIVIDGFSTNKFYSNSLDKFIKKLGEPIIDFLNKSVKLEKYTDDWNIVNMFENLFKK